MHDRVSAKSRLAFGPNLRLQIQDNHMVQKQTSVLLSRRRCVGEHHFAICLHLAVISARVKCVMLQGTDRGAFT